MTVKSTPLFRSYDTTDLDACLQLFDANCPEFFAPNERSEYQRFLANEPFGYELCLLEQRIVGAFGLMIDEHHIGRISWILIDPKSHGSGVGSAMMHRAVERAQRSSLKQINIAASHLSEAFFGKFGARTISRTENGWGEGMHRHDMTIPL